MIFILLFIALWAGLAFFGVGPLRRLAVLVAVWLAGVLGAALMPEGALGDPRHWLILGVVAGLIMGYRGALSRLTRRVVSGAEPGMIGAAPSDVTIANPVMSDAELDRYARHIVLRDIGGPGQQKLRNARVLIVGAGALGAPVALYLAAVGVGRITLADDDKVSLSNLQRQVIYGMGDIGTRKVDAAARRLADLNPHVQVTPLPRRITADDVALIRGFDLVLDGTDSFAARQGVNRACAGAGVALVGGAIAQWEGQLSVWDPVRDAPCLACVFPDEPAPGLAPSCAEAGVVGALPGIIGSMMALEAIKLITGAGSVARGRLQIFDGLWGETRSIAIHRNPDCPVCGSRH